MEPRKGALGRAWDWVGHIHLVSWLFEGAKLTLGPAVALVTVAVGFKEIPAAYLIMATAVGFAAATYIVNQFASLYERNKVGFAVRPRL